MLPQTAAAAEVRLVDLIAAIREQGHSVLYSSDLVHGSMRVSANEASLEALADALPQLGLKLEQEGSVWLIRAGPTLPPVTASNASVAPGRETVIVTGSRYQFPEYAGASSSRRLSARELATTPSLASDLARATLRVPGVSSVGISAKPHIRGGLKDELLILQDGIELIEPFHLADYHSAYSTLDYLTVESVDFYTGGFPSRYGNRMSGVMDISNAWTDREYATHLGISSFASFVNTRQALPNDRGFWGVSYHQGDLSDLTDYIDTRSGDPEYRDASLRFSSSAWPGLNLDMGLTYSEDDIEFEDIGERASSQIDSWHGWVRLDYQFSDQLHSWLTVSGIDFKREKRQVNIEIEDEPEEPGSFLDYEQQVERIGLRHDFRWLRGAVIHEFGWQLDYSDASYDNRSVIDRGDLADIIGTERDIQRDIRLSPDGLYGSAYWAGEWSLGERWLLQPGLRWDWQDYYLDSGTNHQLAPRIGLAFDASDELRLRLSLGRFYQAEGIQELQVLDGIEQFYRPQRSDQVVAGMELSRGDWDLVLEAYYKDYEDPKGRFENVFNPFVLLPEMESDRLGLLPEEARAYGVDIDLQHAFTATLSGQLRYSYMKAEDKLEDTWVDRRWAQEHTVNASLLWQEDNFSIAIAALWHSGWRSSRLPAFIPEDDPIDIVDYLNNTELRDHVSIDISARYRWDFRRARVEVFADISNITDRSNQAGIDYDEEEVDGGYTLEPDQETLLDLVPSVGITLSF